MFRASRRKGVATFKPCLEPLEERYLLDANPAAPLSPEQIEAAFQTIMSLATQSAGQSEASSNSTLSPITELRNNWNTLANDAATSQVKNLPQDARAVLDSVDKFRKPDPVDIALQQVSQLPPGLQRGGADAGMALQGAFVAVGGALTFERELWDSGMKELNGAVDDYFKMLNQATQQFLQGNFSLSSSASSSGQGGTGTPSETLFFDENAPRSSQ
ncbi:MAG TPA: LEPR-XLL domain-containing protein [Gemmataceae bacterium]|jgi:hypothetical protein